MKCNKNAKRNRMRASMILALMFVVAFAYSGSAVMADTTQDGAKNVSSLAYTPDPRNEKYIKELISAKFLTQDVYYADFYSHLTRGELATYAMKLYYYLGGQEVWISPGSIGMKDVEDGSDAGKACRLGIMDPIIKKEYSYGDGTGNGNGGDNGNGNGNGSGNENGNGGNGNGNGNVNIIEVKYFSPNDTVTWGWALTALAKTVMKAKQENESNLLSVESANASLSKKYAYVYNIDPAQIQYIAYMDNRGALLLPHDQQNGNAVLLDGFDINRGNFFVQISDTLWAFAKKDIAPHAIKPDNPTVAEWQGSNPSFFKNNVNLQWTYIGSAYKYEAKLYIEKKFKTALNLTDNFLSLTAYTKPTYKSIFGNMKKSKLCYLKVRTVDRHGIKSSKEVAFYFKAEKFVNVNEKIFGNKNRFGFKSAKEARKYQKTIKVNVWKLSGGKKVKSTMSLTVNKEVADDIKNVFKEIFKGKEKFPINSMGGFQIRSSKTSEHNYGTAIDINPEENCMKDGKKVLSGKYWKPGKDPYSIKPDGDVVKAFAKYGWYWGGIGWGDRKDYMHFSYFHT